MALLVGNNTVAYTDTSGNTGLDINISQTILTDDYVLVFVAQDDNRTFNTPQLNSVNMTLLQGTFGSTAQTVSLWGAKATGDGHTLNLYDLIVDDDAVIYTVVFRDVAAATVLATNFSSVDSSTPTLGALVTTGNRSDIIAFGAMDTDAITNVISTTNAKSLGENDPGDVSACAQYKHIPVSGTSTTLQFAASAADSWSIVGVELTSTNFYKPLALTNFANELGTGGATFTTLPNLFFNDGVAYARNNATPRVLTFDCNQVGTSLAYTGDNMPAIRLLSKLTLTSGTLNPQLVDGGLYYVSGTTSPVTLRRCTAIGQSFADIGTDISVTATTGTFTLTEIGVIPCGRSTGFTVSDASNNNMYGFAYSFGSTVDFSDGTILYDKIETDTAGTLLGVSMGIAYGAYSANGYCWYKIASSGVTGRVTEIAINLAEETPDYESASFDNSAVLGGFWIYLSGGNGTGTNAGIGTPRQILLTPTITGVNSVTATGVSAGLSFSDILSELAELTDLSEDLGSDIYRLGHSLFFGDGGTNETDILLDAGTITFQPTTNLISNTSPNFYRPGTIKFGTDSGASDDFTITNTQIKFDESFDVDTAGSPNSFTLEGNIIINAMVSNAGEDITGVTFINCDINFTTRQLFACTLDNCNAVDADLITACIVKNATNGVFVDSGNTSPTVTLSQTTFENNTNDIDVRDTSGTVTIIHIAGYAPTFTTSGATVILQTPNITISATGMPNASGAERRLQIKNVSGETASAWASSTAQVVGDKRLRSTGVGSENTAGLYFVCSTAGTTGGSEPTWSTTPGATTTDGTVVWTTYNVLFYDDDPASATLDLTYVENRAWKTGDSWDVKFAELDAATSYKIYSNSGLVTANGFSFQVNETESTVYAANAIDGSSAPVTSKFTADYGQDHIDLDSNQDFAVKEVYAYYCYETTTSAGMHNFFGAMEAIDAANYEIKTDVASIFLDESAGFVKQTDNARLFRSDGTRPAIDPTTGGSGLEVNWRNPVNVENLSTLESLASAIKTKTDNLPTDTSAELDAIKSNTNLIPAAL